MYSINKEQGRVCEIVEDYSRKQIVLVRRASGNKEPAINYKGFCGQVKTGDRVVINTTAVDLQLGTGGYHFVIGHCTPEAHDREGEQVIKQRCRRDDQEKDGKEVHSQQMAAADTGGHIIKLRYTPQQLKVLAVEEKEGPHHQKIKNFCGLKGLPVVIIPLHSLLAPFAIVFKKCYPEKKLVYIMTGGGSLSLELSHQVQKLRARGVLDTTITAGQAYGGHLEAVNIFTALAAAREVAAADMVVVGMGPGQAGTGTPLGFSGMENVFSDYAVKQLEGESLLVPRLSFADKRDRHFFLSHHTATMLEFMSPGCEIIFPDCELVKAMLAGVELPGKHDYFFYDYTEILNILLDSNFVFETMGRNLQQDPVFFVSGALPVLRYKSKLKE